MFRKFTPKDDVGSIVQLKSSVVRGVRQKLASQYEGVQIAEILDQVIPKKADVYLAKCSNKVSIYICDQQALFVQERDGPLIPTLALLHRYPQLLPHFQVDTGAIKFVLAGANIMCPGLTSPGAELDMSDRCEDVGSLVAVHAEGKQHALAVGRLLMSRSDIINVNQGHGVENLHFLNDGLWKNLAALADNAGVQNIVRLRSVRAMPIIEDIYLLLSAQPRPFGPQLYAGLRDLLADHCDEIHNTLVSDSGAQGSLLARYFASFATYHKGSLYVDRLCRYLNTHWIDKRRDVLKGGPARHELPDDSGEVFRIKTLCLVMWRRLVHNRLLPRLSAEFVGSVNKARSTLSLADASPVQRWASVCNELGAGNENGVAGDAKFLNARMPPPAQTAPPAVAAAEASSTTTSTSRNGKKSKRRRQQHPQQPPTPATKKKEPTAAAVAAAAEVASNAGPDGVYARSLEQPLLKSTGHFYEEAAHGAGRAPVAFCLFAIERLEFELRLCTMLASQATTSQVMRICVGALVSDERLQSMLDSLRPAVQDDGGGDGAQWAHARSVHRLVTLLVAYGGSDAPMDALVDAVRQAARDAGVAHVQHRVLGDKDADDVEAAVKSESGCVALVDALLARLQLERRRAAACFGSEARFAALVFVVLRLVANTTVRADLTAECLAKYMHLALQGRQVADAASAPTATDAASSTVAAAAPIYSLLDEKDVFHAWYTRLLASRLFAKGDAADFDAERAAVGALKQAALPFEHAVRVGRMLADVERSVELREHFVAYVDEHAAGGDMQRQLARVFQPIVAADGVWPPMSRAVAPAGASAGAVVAAAAAAAANGDDDGDADGGAPVLLPATLTDCLVLFEQFYAARHTQRRLRWISRRGRIVLRCHCFRRRYEITCTEQQAAALLMFTRADERTRQEVVECAGANALAALLESRLTRVVDGERVRINEKFAVKRLRFSIAALPKRREGDDKKAEAGGDSAAAADAADAERARVASQVAEERRTLVSACAVRVMKARKSLRHSELVQAVIEQLSSRFVPDVALIKRCIESLIEQEYLERKEGSMDEYDYVA